MRKQFDIKVLGSRSRPDDKARRQNECRHGAAWRWGSGCNGTDRHFRKQQPARQNARVFHSLARRSWQIWIGVLTSTLLLSGTACSPGASGIAHASAIIEAIKAGSKQRAIELIRAHPKCVNTADPVGVGAPADPGGLTRGWTMLHLAAYCGQPDVCEALLQSGASVNAEINGVTPLDATLGTNPKHPRREDILLFRSGHGGRIPAVAQVLRKAGARGNYYEAAASALRRLNDTTEMKTLDALTNGLRNSQP